MLYRILSFLLSGSSLANLSVAVQTWRTCLWRSAENRRDSVLVPESVMGGGNETYISIYYWKIFMHFILTELCKRWLLCYACTYTLALISYFVGVFCSARGIKMEQHLYGSVFLFCLFVSPWSNPDEPDSDTRAAVQPGPSIAGRARPRAPDVRVHAQSVHSASHRRLGLLHQAHPGRQKRTIQTMQLCLQ